MTVGNFTELMGTGSDSISGSDLEIVYALNGNDVLNSATTFLGNGLPNGKSTTILVGGTGRNSYQIRNNSTAIIIENDNNSDNILWTTIGGSGFGLEKETTFFAEIENRHLYISDTDSDKYAILIDWQKPANRIETFDFVEGYLSYEEFVSRFRQSKNYRGNFTWDELVATGEIDLARLGLSSYIIDDAIATVIRKSAELEGSVFLVGTDEGEFLEGSRNNDSLQGGLGNDSLYGFGGRDTLEGGLDDDLYSINVKPRGGSEIRDTGGQLDDLLIIAFNTENQTLSENYYYDNYLALRADYTLYGDSAIALSLPQPGIVGLEKSDNNLIVDIDRDGVARSENDLTLFDFFDNSGNSGTGAIERINNIIDTQDIIDFFSTNPQHPQENFGDNTIYRFYDGNSGVHFYTADIIERNHVRAYLSNYTYEGASYASIEPLTGLEPLAIVHRFFNRDSGTHLYTTDENERNIVQQTLSNFNYEGEAFYAYNIPIEGATPIYRFYNPSTGAHFYTPSTIERDYVTNELSNFQSEGIAYYALPVDSSAVV